MQSVVLDQRIVRDRGQLFLCLKGSKSEQERFIRNSRYIKQASAVSIYVINSYLKILKPAYLVNICLQRNTSSIAEVIPAISKLINNWENLLNTECVSSSCKNFWKFLIQEFETRFNYELEAELYQVKTFIIF